MDRVTDAVERQAGPRAGPVVAIVPVGTLTGAKSRLGAVLDAEEREELTLRLARTTIGAVVAARRIDETLVVTPGAIDEVAAALDDPRRPLVAIVPDRHGRGTNALLVAPPDAIEPCFGGDSRAAHAAAAEAAGAVLVELDGPLSVDLDTPDDLLLAEASLRLPSEPVR
jgi:2-phospho-L-lactate guanylyltransferase